jgi:hypothetical protein
MKHLFVVKCMLSSVLIMCASCYIIYGISFGYSRNNESPIINFIFLLCALVLLAYFESGQVAVVNISTIDEKQTLQLIDSHPRTFEIYRFVKPKGVVETYLIGRQLCVIAIVFLISNLTTFPMMPDMLPKVFEHALITTGFPGVLVTLAFGQIFPQLIAYEYTIRFLNTRGTLLAIKIAVAIESIKVFTNLSWIVTNSTSKIVPSWKGTGDNINTLSPSTHGLMEYEDSVHSNIDMVALSSQHASIQKDPRAQPTVQKNENVCDEHSLCWRLLCLSNLQNANVDTNSNILLMGLDVICNCISVAICIFSFTIILYGFYKEHTILPLNSFLLVFLFLFTLCCIFYLEGLQVAILSLPTLSSTVVQSQHPNLLPIYALFSTSQNSRNTVDNISSILDVKRFLMGRQFLVVLAMFTMAYMTTYHEYSLPAKMSIHKHAKSCLDWYIASGLSGILVTLNTVQMPSQMLAKQNPVKFLSLPCVYYIIQLCIFCEQLGICHFGWVLFYICRYICF